VTFYSLVYLFGRIIIVVSNFLFSSISFKEKNNILFSQKLYSN